MTKKRKTGTVATKKSTRSRRKSGKNWLVAVDPFTDIDLTAWLDFAEASATAAGASLYAAYVLAPESFNWTGEFSGPWMKKYKPIAEEKMRGLLEGRGGIRSTVVPCREPGLRASVRTLFRFAQKLKAECIVLSTHARTGIERWSAGSFAETLMLASKVPLLIVNPAHPPPERVRRLLVPIDLDQSSDKYALAAAEFARGLGAEVVLFHKQPDPMEPLIQQGIYTFGGGWVSVPDFIEADLSAKSRRLKRLAAKVEKKGVITHHSIDSSGRGLIEAIAAAVKEHQADVVSVFTRAGPWSAVLLGSVARALVRASEVPVLVCR
jgi:nucleotide-binding universal stress UspA family protein